MFSDFCQNYHNHSPWQCFSNVDGSDLEMAWPQERQKDQEVLLVGNGTPALKEVVALTPNCSKVLGKAQHRYVEKSRPFLLRNFHMVCILKAFSTAPEQM